MTDLTESPTVAMIVGAPSTSLTELQGLVHTLGMEIVECIELPRITATAKFGIGTGKAVEIVTKAQELKADCIIFDFDITPTQQRNLEKIAEMPVFDKQEVILRIFAQRAQTKEAVLQVELAKLQYSLPRLAHIYGDMAKQRGGNFGAKGSGETQLELDKRAVVTKTAKIKKDLEKVVKERETQRKQRDVNPIPLATIVGYTNAGKSSLLNALTSSNVFVEDKLFATLDPTTRRFTLQGKTELLLTDTVGFISNLPHSLIDAFKSTLEESARANLQLLVLDGSDPQVFAQYETVVKVLSEINANDNERLIVINKCDKFIAPEIETLLKQKFNDAVWISAKTKQGFDELSELITKKLFGDIRYFSFPLNRADLVQKIRNNGMLIEEEWQDSCIQVTARVKGKLENVFNQYIFEK
jgi:GTP-binding protein HflX